MGACASGTASTASTAPSHGIRNASALNAELNHVARNTDDCARAQKLVAAGADLNSTNGGVWRHTPLHQAAYHGRFDMARTLVLLGARLDLPSNPCGRGGRGLPIDLARGGGHHRIVAMLERAQGGGVHGRKVEEDDGLAPVVVEGTDATSTAMSSATRAGDAVALQSAVLAVAGSQPPFRALSRVRTRDGDTALITCWHRKGGTGSGGVARVPILHANFGEWCWPPRPGLDPPWKPLRMDSAGLCCARRRHRWAAGCSGGAAGGGCRLVLLLQGESHACACASAPP